MKLFVTGGSGFVGSYFINRATEKGHDLTCIRRKDSQPKIKIAFQPKWIEGRLEDDFTSSMKGCSTLVHMAACGVSPQKSTKDELLKVNIIDSYKLIQTAFSSGIENFLIIGTSDEYGKSGMRYKFIPPDAPLEPTSDYAASKAALFQLLHSFTIEKNIKLIYARIFNAYGIGQYKKNLWPSMRIAALSGEDFFLTQGEQVRSFISVEEVAKQLVKSLDFSAVETGATFIKHIGVDSPQTIRKFAEYWWKEWGATGKLHFGAKPYRENEVMRYVPLVEWDK
jgi:nucleoside-diphosphate-sugar epimerase